MNKIHKTITVVGLCLTLSSGITTAFAKIPEQIIAQTSAAEFYNQGNVRFDQKDYNGAIAYYTQALKIDPNFTDAYFSRGLARALLKQYPGALGDANQMLQLNPNSPEAYRLRGAVRYQMKDVQGTVADWRTAANLYRSQGDIESAQEMMDNLTNLRQGLERILR